MINHSCLTVSVVGTSPLCTWGETEKNIQYNKIDDYFLGDSGNGDFISH